MDVVRFYSASGAQGGFSNFSPHPQAGRIEFSVEKSSRPPGTCSER